MRWLAYVFSLLLVPSAAMASYAVYWVPVEPWLQQYAVFDSSVIVKKTADHMELSYPLPLELTGAENIISLEGPIPSPGQPLVLEGGGSKLTCPGSELTRCEVSYTGYAVQYDEAKRDELLKKLSANSTEFAARKSVAASFQGGEPHGFLMIPGAQKAGE